MKPNSSKEWQQFWLVVAGLHAILFGVLLYFRNFYFHWINLSPPEPPLYGDLASAFLIIIGLWTLWTAYDMSPQLWIIPAGSGIGRATYFTLALIGYLTNTNGIIYVLIGTTDAFFAIILIWVTLQMRKTLSKVKIAN